MQKQRLYGMSHCSGSFFVKCAVLDAYQLNHEEFLCVIFMSRCYLVLCSFSTTNDVSVVCAWVNS
jgi:hypothetical protein